MGDETKMECDCYQGEEQHGSALEAVYPTPKPPFLVDNSNYRSRNRL
jgi:hypothetical protein